MATGFGFAISDFLWDAGDIDDGDLMCPFCNRPCHGDKCIAWRYDGESAGRGFCIRMMSEIENANVIKFQETSNLSFEFGLAFYEEVDTKDLVCPYADRNCAGEKCGAWCYHHDNVGYCSRIVAAIASSEIDNCESSDEVSEVRDLIIDKNDDAIIFDPEPF